MNTFTFVLPPNSPLQRTVSASRRSQWLWIMLVVVGIHIVLLGSFLLQGWRRQNGLISPAGGVAALEQAMWGGLSAWPKAERTNLGDGLPSGQALHPAAAPIGLPASSASALATDLIGSTVTQTETSGEHSYAGSEYVVKPGDSLSRIAKAYSLTVKGIWAANDLKTDRLSIGQKLILPSPIQSDSTSVPETAAD